MLDDVKDGFLRGMRQAVEQKNERANVLLAEVEIYATHEEQTQLYQQIFALLAPYEQRRDQVGETLHSVFMLYPVPSTSQLEQQSRKVAESAQSYTESPRVMPFSRSLSSEWSTIIRRIWSTYWPMDNVCTSWWSGAALLLLTYQ
ncbi:hypothetical protein KDW_59350 [Dictyobacter vulcani]|uniref:Uncharacterized protein n=1 Tax=Dictyobacter vulcani TaxID=2607529 RepID=A0A5J4KW99_9CHLR|nr:hypothetical protein KDW_59350 [Dictyobacter vulcani]